MNQRGNKTIRHKTNVRKGRDCGCEVGERRGKGCFSRGEHNMKVAREYLIGVEDVVNGISWGDDGRGIFRINWGDILKGQVFEGKVGYHRVVYFVLVDDTKREGNRRENGGFSGFSGVGTVRNADVNSVSSSGEENMSVSFRESRGGEGKVSVGDLDDRSVLWDGEDGKSVSSRRSKYSMSTY